MVFILKNSWTWLKRCHEGLSAIGAGAGAGAGPRAGTVESEK